MSSAPVSSYGLSSTLPWLANRLSAVVAKSRTRCSSFFSSTSGISVMVFTTRYLNIHLSLSLLISDIALSKPAIFTTMDITTDGFGFMLSIGDLAWVPFVYSLQARYLVFNQVELGTFLTVLVFALHSVGYYIFRSANGEKNDFRNGRNPKSTFSTCPHPRVRTIPHPY